MTRCRVAMVFNRQHRVRIDLKPLRAFAARAHGALGLDGREWTVCLVSDAEIARMNRAFRRKAGPTDVLSFPADGNRRQGGREVSKQGRKATGAQRTQKETRNKEKSRASACYLGDVAISPETARRNALRHGEALGDELRILILHGLLHLMGYDHETDHGEMDRRERRLRRRLGLS